MTDQQQLDVGVSPDTDPNATTVDRSPRTAQDEPEPPTDYPGGESPGCTYLYAARICEDHTNPAGECPDGHLTCSMVSIDGVPALEQTLLEKLDSVECGCGGDLEHTTIRGEWPPENPTTESILDVFRETNGQIVLECYPGDIDRRFYIGEIGGRYYVETEHYTNPELPTGEDDLPALVTEHPTTLSSVDDTPLEGAYEDYTAGVL